MVTVLLSIVSILLTINLYILKGVREDFKRLWEKIDLLFEKNDKTLERLIKAESDIENCVKEWNRRHGDVKEN